MKKFYSTPELEITILSVDEILLASLENEVEIDGKDLFS